MVCALHLLNSQSCVYHWKAYELSYLLRAKSSIGGEREIYYAKLINAHEY